MKAETTGKPSPTYSTGFLKSHVESKLGGHCTPIAMNKLRGALISMAEADTYFPVTQIVGEYVSQGAPRARLKMITRAAGSVISGFAITNTSLNLEGTIEGIRRATSKDCDFGQYETFLRKELARGWEHPWRRESIWLEERRNAAGGRPPLSEAAIITRSKLLTHELEKSNIEAAKKLASSIYQWAAKGSKPKAQLKHNSVFPLFY